MKIVFFGTSEFGKIILERLIQSEYKPFLVVTAPDARVGRNQKVTSSPVKILAREYEIPVIQPEKFDSSYNPDLIIVAAYGRILPKKILDMPKHGALNVHASLLPRWRGPSPIQYAILSGDEETGVTIIKMDEKMDHGPLLAQRKFLISNFKFLNGIAKPTASELSRELAVLGADLLLETIPLWIAGEIIPLEQAHQNATYTKIITKKDGHIDWRNSAEEIERKLRAFSPWPGVFTFWDNKRVKILKARVIDSQASEEQKTSPGFVLPSKNELLIAAGQWVFAVEILQIEGKNQITAKEFLNGHPEIPGSKFV